MRTFYVRPERESGYGAGDGTSYENAWNGLSSVKWDAFAAQPARLWICGERAARDAFIAVYIDWSDRAAWPMAA